MPEHPLWSQISSHHTALKHSLTLGWNTAWPWDVQRNFRKRLPSLNWIKLGFGSFWVDVNYAKNYATARVGAKQRVWNQGSGEDVGGDGGPIWVFLVIPVTLCWSGTISVGGRDRWLLLSPEQRCESIPELWSGNVSKHPQLLMTSYEESHFNLARHLISISTHSSTLTQERLICAFALLTADRSSFKYMWLQRNHQASCLCYKWASEFLDSYWLFKPFDFNLMQLLTWKTGAWKWGKQPWDSNPCCRADGELSADHEYGPGFVHSHRACLKFHIQLSFFYW